MQGYKINNGYSDFSVQTIFDNQKINPPYRAAGKPKLSQTYTFQENVCNELLKDFFIFDEKDFFDSMDLIYLDKNEYLYEPDEVVRYLYFPESAVISEFQLLENGKTVEVSMTGREGVVGINSILGSQPTHNFSQVLIPGRALRISPQFFRQQIAGCEYFQKNVFAFINQYISQISQRVVCNNHHSTEERLCLWLMMITERCRKSVLPLTQEQIARFLGVHRPSVTLITQSLRNKEIIDYVRGKISIIDPRKLENSACACYSAMRKNRK